MLLTFEKWQACQNDFMVTWLADSDGEVVLGSLKRQAEALCHRRTGIGADGILVLKVHRTGDLTPYGLTIINSDGSLAQTCGNGLRCAALSVLMAHRERGNPKSLPELVTFDVEERSLTCRFVPGRSQLPFVVVEMGTPIIGTDLPWHATACSEVARVASAIDLPLLAREVVPVDIGNKHLVITTDLASRDTLLKVGPELQKSSAWDGINVHLVRSKAATPKDQFRSNQEIGHDIGEIFEAYVWERGAGETMACGSGACAIAATAYGSGLTERSEWIAVDMPGGRLYTKQSSPSEPVSLAGPGALVFVGKVQI